MAPAASPPPVPHPATTAGPGTASHVAERGADHALATHTNSAQRWVMTKTGAMGTSSKAATPSSTLPKSATHPPIAPTDLPTPSKSTATACKKPPTTSTTTTTPLPKPDRPSAPVTVHPAPSVPPPSNTTSTRMRRPGRKPYRPTTAADDPHTHHDPSFPSRSTDSTEPPDPALFTFPSLLSSLGAEASDPLHAIAEICGRSKMSLADEHGSHLPPTTKLLRQEEAEEGGREGGEEGAEPQRRNQGRDVRAGAAGVAVQRVDVRGRRGSAPLEGETHTQAGGGNGGKGWMEGVMAWLRGGVGAGEGGGTAREKRKAVRDLRRVLEEREGETSQS